jgi:hypothetical protein
MPAKPLPPDHTPHARHVLDVLWQATDDDLSRGMSWYALAYAHAVRLSPDDPAVGAGVLAALSPQLGWGRSVDLAEQSFRAGTALGVRGQTYANLQKADYILSGTYAPLEVLGGPKVRAFYRAIMGDANAVVIDRHALAVACQAGREADPGILRRAGVYDRFSHAYVTAARMFRDETHGALALTPTQAQAVAWVVWRRLHDADWHDAGRK